MLFIFGLFQDKIKLLELYKRLLPNYHAYFDFASGSTRNLEKEQWVLHDVCSAASADCEFGQIAGHIARRSKIEFTFVEKRSCFSSHFLIFWTLPCWLLIIIITVAHRRRKWHWIQDLRTFFITTGRLSMKYLLRSPQKVI